MNLFAEDLFYSDLQYAGLFYNYSDEYMESIARFIHKLRNLRKTSEAPKLRQALEGFLSEKKTIEGDAIYGVREVKEWSSPWKVKLHGRNTGFFHRRSEKSFFNIYELRVGSASQVKNRAGLVFLRLKGYEDSSPPDEEKKWEARRQVLIEWERLSEKSEVKAYLAELREVYDILRGSLPTSYTKPPFYTIAYYLFPIELRWLENTFIVSKASLYKRRPETRSGLWDEIWKRLHSSTEMENYRKDLEEGLRESGKDWDYLRSFLDKALFQDHLNMLREDWKQFLKKCLEGKSNKLEGVFVWKKNEENPPSLSHGTYLVPADKISVSIWVEEGFKLKYNGRKLEAKDIKNILSEKAEELSKKSFFGNCRIEFDEELRPIESLFGGKEYFKLLSLKSEKETRRMYREVKAKIA